MSFAFYRMGDSLKQLAEPDFMKSDFILNLSDPKTFHDRVLTVGGRKFYVVATTLAAASDYFHTMFYGPFDDANKKEIEIKEVDPEAFEIFLYILFEESNSVYLQEEHLVSVIGLTYRFLAPSILEACKEFIHKNIDKLDSIILDLLETVYQYDINDLKEAILDRLKNHAVLSKFETSDILECANRFKIYDLKVSLGSYIGESATSANCIELLEFAEKKNLPTLKAKIADKIAESTWNSQFAPKNQLIDLLKAAFKYEVEPLKEWVFTNMLFRDYLRKHEDEILSLPTEMKDFVLEFMINKCIS